MSFVSGMPSHYEDIYSTSNNSNINSSSSSYSSSKKIKNRGSLIWVTGSFCSPLRLHLGCLFTILRMKKADYSILGIIAGSILLVYLLLQFLQSIISPDPQDRSWILNLCLNMMGYGTVFLPGYLVIQYVRQNNYLDSSVGSACMEKIVKLVVVGNEDSLVESMPKSGTGSTNVTSSAIKDAMTLLFCFVGLQGSYLTWGVLQEKIMTQNYVDSIGNSGKFTNSQFLVFVNRILAFAIALFYITLSSKEPRHKAPIYKYIFCSFSNIMSSWFQYEALKFITFPTQVLAKASKIIPVMLMGKIVSNKKYEFYEYIVAILISFGMALFLFGSSDGSKDTNRTSSFSGLVLLIGYMASDAFTSNWQGKLFSTYKMSSVQMMAGVNLFSCLLTISSLLQQGAFYESLVFMSQYPKFTFDCVILSICSAVGQLFIYYTISCFGPVIFVIIMTLRQAMAILLSCLIYNHPLNALGIIGVLTVFGAMFIKIYCSYRIKQLNKMQQNTVNVKL